MADLQAPKKPSVTPRQLVVVGVLGVVLVIVLISQFGGATGTPGEPAAAAGPKGPLSPASQAAGRKPSAASLAQAEDSKGASPAWPKFTADVVAQYDPFAVPQAMSQKITAPPRAAEVRKSPSPPPKPDASAEKMAALKSKGIALIVRGERGALAMIGNRVVRVGDVLEGYRVVSIDLQGVVLAPADRQESHEVRK